MTISRRRRLADAALDRALSAPKQRNSYAVRAVQVPMRDGTTLLADHYAPETPAQRGTVLVRTPYGRGFPTSSLNGRMFAARGYHAVIQSVRGTFGSGGTFEPMAQETDDGQDTVAWLRTQPWFDGRLATLGGSYLAWTQWALLQDPPPELRTAIVYVGPHDFREAVFGRGAFTLGDFLGWTNQIITQESGGGLRRLARATTVGRTLAPVLAGLPLADAADPLLRGRAPWYRTWLSHPDGDDPFWGRYRAGAALSRVNVPVLLVGGWQDMFLDQTLEQYQVLRDRGVEVGLTVGPWTHLETATRAAGLVNRESIEWLDTHLAGEPPVRRQPVRVFRTGEKAWHELASWPPPAAPATYHLHPEGYLTEKGNGVAGAVSFDYDPADPTPSVGGRVMNGSMGVRDNRELEARADVVTFTSDRLATAVDVVGSPVVTLTVAVDNPYADVFVRLCDVDERGRSHNVTDVLHRLDPAVPPGEPHHLTLTLDPCFHRLLPGHRARLQISGGAFPRYARNLGTDGAPATGNILKPSIHTIDCAAATLLVPKPA
jgi:putative CocE/NonD family hydrolase